MRPRFFRRALRGAVLAALFALTLPVSASATWSIVAVDGARRVVVIASATCVPASGLRRANSIGLYGIQAVVVPGVGVAAAQAGVDGSLANQRLILTELKKGTNPDDIIGLLADDPSFQGRQFGIVDLQGRAAGFSGSRNGVASLAVATRVHGTEITFSIQGNILASDQVVLDAVAAFRATEGTVEDRVIAAMEAADAAGGDSRCTCERAPIPDAPCTTKTAHVAYILSAEATDPPGTSINDGEYSLFISVDDENITPDEDANPVKTLRMRYDAWKAGQGQVDGEGLQGTGT